MGDIIDRIRRVTSYPVVFEDGGAERHLTLNQAAALKRRIELAIAKAHDEIRARPQDPTR